MPSLASLFLQSVGLSQNEELLLRFTSPESLGRFMMAVIAMIVGYYYIIFLKQRRTSQKSILAEELQLAQANIQYLQAKLLTLDGNNNNNNYSSSSSRDEQQHSNSNNHHNHNKKEIRIFMDGAFDLMHYGHMNAFRLARSLGTHLVVGVNSDESITECKGEPLMKDHERLTMVQSCKFVDEVVPGCPYIMNKRYVCVHRERKQIRRLCFSLLWTNEVIVDKACNVPRTHNSHTDRSCRFHSTSSMLSDIWIMCLKSIESIMSFMEMIPASSMARTFTRQPRKPANFDLYHAPRECQRRNWWVACCS